MKVAKVGSDNERDYGTKENPRNEPWNLRFYLHILH